MFPNLREDLGNYGGPWEQLKALMLFPRVWSIVVYRFRRWSHTSRMPAILRFPLILFGRIAAALLEAVTHVELPKEAVIGPGLFLPHAGYVIVASNATLGRQCTLAQGVTVGHRAGGREESLDSPVIGDRVYVGPGAAVLGPINVGDDALIGPNAILIKSVPSRAVIVGNPGRVVSMSGSFQLISPSSAGHDEAPLASMAELK